MNYGLKTLSYRSPQLWSLLPEKIKEVESLELFKREVRTWICDDCPCRLCKPYLQKIEFLLDYIYSNNLECIILNVNILVDRYKLVFNYV